VVVLLYNPVALANAHGEAGAGAQRRLHHRPNRPLPRAAEPYIGSDGRPLVLVVDDSVTVRRVTQRLLVREGIQAGAGPGWLSGARDARR